MLPIVEKAGSVTFKVRIQPRASRNELVGEYGDALKLRITAPPVDGKANELCCRFLADLLDVPLSSVEIVSGESSRDKMISVRAITSDQVRRKLAPSKVNP